MKKEIQLLAAKNLALIFAFYFLASSYTFANLNHVKNLSAVKDWGEAYIEETNGFKIHQSDIIPWSSDWLPYSGGSLFLGPNSTNALYDRYSETQGFRTTAREREEVIFFAEHRNTPLWPPYAGRCIGRAISACCFKGPFGTYCDDENDLKIPASDIANLLTQTCDLMPNLKIYGNLNDEGDDLQDMYPHEFHRFLQVQLIEKKLPVIINFDAHPKTKWFVPIYRIEYKISYFKPRGEFYTELDEETGETLYGMNVTLKVTWSDYKNFRKDRTDVVPDGRTYHYLLLGLPEGEGLRVKKGRWRLGSKNNHPDCAVLIPTPEDMEKRRCLNEQIRNDVVEELYNRACEQFNPEDYPETEETNQEEAPSLVAVEYLSDDEGTCPYRPSTTKRRPKQRPVPEEAKEEPSPPTISEAPPVPPQTEPQQLEQEKRVHYSHNSQGLFKVIENEEADYLKKFCKKHKKKIVFTKEHIEAARNSPEKEKIIIYYYLKALKKEIKALKKAKADKSKINKLKEEKDYWEKY